MSIVNMEFEQNVRTSGGLGINKPPNFSSEDRGKEIKSWINKSDGEAYSFILYERLIETIAHHNGESDVHFHDELLDDESFLVSYVNDIISPLAYKEALGELQKLQSQPNYNAHKGYMKSSFDGDFDL